MLYRDLRPSVLRYRRVLAPGAAEDLAAEIWLRVARKLVRAVICADWHAASQALDDLMGKLVVRRLLEAEGRLPKREPWTDPM